MNRLLLSFHLTTSKRLKLARIPIGVTLTKWVNLAICEKLDRDQPDTILDPAQLEEIAREAKQNKRKVFEAGGTIPPPTLGGSPHIDAYANLKAAQRRERGVDYVGPWTWYYEGTTIHRQAIRDHKNLGSDSPGVEALIEDGCVRDNYGVLSPEKQKAIMEEQAEKMKSAAPAPPVPDHLLGHPQRIKRWRAAGSPVEALPRVPGMPQIEYPQETTEYLALAAKPAPVEAPPLVNVATPASEPEDFWGADDDGYAKIKRKAQSRI